MGITKIGAFEIDDAELAEIRAKLAPTLADTAFVTDFNVDLHTGEHYTNAVSYPGAASGYGYLRVFRFDQDYALQVWTEATTGQTWERRKFATWQPWRRVFKQDNILGTVSQSGGVPTGAVIERGSNANGDYVKFADGTMICTHMSGAVWAAANADTNYAWTFPAVFVTSPATNVGYEPYSTQSYSVQKCSPGNGSATGSSLWFRTDNAQNFRLAFTAVGRWF